jgi:hypothetical protein
LASEVIRRYLEYEARFTTVVELGEKALERAATKD